MHPSRERVEAELAHRDPATEWREINRDLVQLSMPREFRVGLSLALYRTFTAPKVGGLIHQAGVHHGNPVMRNLDTALIVMELVEHGYDHPRGREMMRLLNHVHRPYSIRNKDYLYVLACFIVVSVRWADEAGWRTVTESERSAITRFFVEMGRRMRIRDMPPTFVGWSDFLDDYEEEELEPTEAAKRLIRESFFVLQQNMGLPRGVRPLAGPFMPQITSALFNSAHIAAASGLPPPRPRLARFFRAQARKRSIAKNDLPSRPWFVPGDGLLKSVYPEGYDLGDLAADARHGDVGESAAKDVVEDQ